MRERARVTRITQRQRNNGLQGFMGEGEAVGGGGIGSYIP
jgi:hypothetical protein